MFLHDYNCILACSHKKIKQNIKETVVDRLIVCIDRLDHRVGHLVGRLGPLVWSFGPLRWPFGSSG